MREEQYALAANLIAMRKVCGYTQAQLAKAAGISRASLWVFEAAEGDPRVSSLVKLANAFEVPTRDLFLSAADFPEEAPLSFRPAGNALLSEINGELEELHCRYLRHPSPLRDRGYSSLGELLDRAPWMTLGIKASCAIGARVRGAAGVRQVLQLRCPL